MLFVFGRIVHKTICIHPNSLKPLFGTPLHNTPLIITIYLPHMSFLFCVVLASSDWWMFSSEWTETSAKHSCSSQLAVRLYRQEVLLISSRDWPSSAKLTRPMVATLRSTHASTTLNCPSIRPRKYYVTDFLLPPRRKASTWTRQWWRCFS